MNVEIDFGKWPTDAEIRRNLYRAAHVFSAELFGGFAETTEAELLTAIAELRASLVPRVVRVSEMATYQYNLPEDAVIDVCDIDPSKVASLRPKINFAVNQGYVMSGNVEDLTATHHSSEDNKLLYSFGRTPMSRAMHPVDKMEYEAAENIAQNAFFDLLYTSTRARSDGRSFGKKHEPGTKITVTYEAAVAAVDALASAYRRQSAVVKKYADGPPLRFRGFDVFFEPTITPGLRETFLDNLDRACDAIVEFGATSILYGAIVCAMTPDWAATVKKGIKTYVPNDRYAALYSSADDIVLINMGRLSYLNPSVLVHELGHRMDYKVLSKEQRQKWVDTVSKRVESLKYGGWENEVTVASSTYGFTNTAESFAEFMAAYCWGVDGSSWDQKHTKVGDDHHSLENEEAPVPDGTTVLNLGFRQRSHTKPMPRARFREFCGLPDDGKPPYWIPNRAVEKEIAGRKMRSSDLATYGAELKGLTERYSPMTVRQMMAMAHAPEMQKIIRTMRAQVTSSPEDRIGTYIEVKRAGLPYPDINSVEDFAKVGLNADFCLGIRLGDSPLLRAAKGYHASGRKTGYLDKHQKIVNQNARATGLQASDHFKPGPLFVQKRVLGSSTKIEYEDSDLRAMVFYALTGHLSLGEPLLAKAIIDQPLYQSEVKMEERSERVRNLAASGRPVTLDDIRDKDGQYRFQRVFKVGHLKAVADLSAAHHGMEMPAELPGGIYSEFSIRTMKAGDTIRLGPDAETVVTQDMIDTAVVRTSNFLDFMNNVIRHSTFHVVETTMEYAREAASITESSMTKFSGTYLSEGQSLGNEVFAEFEILAKVTSGVPEHYRILVTHHALSTAFIGQPVAADNAALYKKGA